LFLKVLSKAVRPASSNFQRIVRGPFLIQCAPSFHYEAPFIWFCHQSLYFYLLNNQTSIPLITNQLIMSKVTIGSFQEFAQYIGKEIGVSDYLTIDQARINQFAGATLDHQWIHTDTKRAAIESPFKKTIAHGYLALSLVPYLWNQIAEINNIKMLINYGIDKLKFNQPVVVDSDVRLKVKLASLVNLRGIAKAELDAELEIKDNAKPAFTATVILLYHFNS
jgi:acyl dehydratase